MIYFFETDAADDHLYGIEADGFFDALHRCRELLKGPVRLFTSLPKDLGFDRSPEFPDVFLIEKFRGNQRKRA